MKTKVPGDPGKNFVWRGVKFTRRTRPAAGADDVWVDFISGQGERWWIHSYEVRESGPYGQLTGIIKWKVFTPLSVPGPSGCFGGGAEGHGDDPVQALENALESASKQASEAALELVKAMAAINTLKTFTSTSDCNG